MSAQPRGEHLGEYRLARPRMAQHQQQRPGRFPPREQSHNDLLHFADDAVAGPPTLICRPGVSFVRGDPAARIHISGFQARQHDSIGSVTAAQNRRLDPRPVARHQVAAGTFDRTPAGNLPHKGRNARQPRVQAVQSVAQFAADALDSSTRGAVVGESRPHREFRDLSRQSPEILLIASQRDLVQVGDLVGDPLSVGFAKSLPTGETLDELPQVNPCNRIVLSKQLEGGLIWALRLGQGDRGMEQRFGQVSIARPGGYLEVHARSRATRRDGQPLFFGQLEIAQADGAARGVEQLAQSLVKRRDDDDRVRGDQTLRLVETAHPRDPVSDRADNVVTPSHQLVPHAKERQRVKGSYRCHGNSRAAQSIDDLDDRRLVMTEQADRITIRRPTVGESERHRSSASCITTTLAIITCRRDHSCGFAGICLPGVFVPASYAVGIVHGITSARPRAAGVNGGSGAHRRDLADRTCSCAQE